MKTKCLRAVPLTFLALIFFLISPAFAWWNTAHELVAQIAEDKLSATAKAKVQALLSVDIVYPGNLELSRKSDTMVTCAPWADTILSKTHWHTSTQKDFFASLHYVNVPIPQDAVPSMETSEQRFLETIRNNPVQNADYAIKSAIKVLGSTDQDPVQAATALRFLIHFVGDIHQPFHVSDPLLDGKGTYGGNLVYLNSIPYFTSEKNSFSIEINGAPYNSATELHAYWDAMGGAFKQLPDPTYVSITSEQLAYLALASWEIDGEYAGDFVSEINDPNVDDWAIESNYYASVYYTTDMLVPRFVDCESNSCFNNNFQYEQDSAVISKMRIYLGGQRLGNFLNTLFDSEAVVPIYAQYIQEIVADPSVYNIYTF